MASPNFGQPSLLSDAWQCKLAVKLTLAPSDITVAASVKPVFLVASRANYLHTLAAHAYPFFQHVLPSIPGAALLPKAAFLHLPWCICLMHISKHAAHLSTVLYAGFPVSGRLILCCMIEVLVHLFPFQASHRRSHGSISAGSRCAGSSRLACCTTCYSPAARYPGH